MILDEQDLRERLQNAAERAGPPRFTVDGLIGRIRWRRARIIGLASATLLSLAAVAVAVPISLGDQRTGPIGQPAPAAPLSLSFMVRVNGEPGIRLPGGPIPKFAVTPGEHLRISIGVTVLAHARLTTLTPRVTALWLGVSGGVLGAPGDLRPILAHSRAPLTPGLHVFWLRWTVPAGLARGTTRYLVANWKAPQVAAAQFIAVLVRRH